MASELEQKIIKQIEYYFGDYNLARDKFLKEKVRENDGWVDISVLITFNRLASLSTDPKVIVNALEKSENGIVAVNEDRTKIRRASDKAVPEFDDGYKKELMKRTAYVKGFPLDESLDDLLAFMEKEGSIQSCVRRSYVVRATNTHAFKGSCYVVFTKVEDCKNFIEAESIKYKDVELIRKWQSAYLDEKRNETRSVRNERKKKNVYREIIEESKKPLTYPKGAFLYFSGLSKGNVLTREEIRAKITEVNEIEPAYIDFNKGDEEGYIRMSDENGAVDFHNKLTDGVLEIDEVKLQFKVLEGEEEELYLQKTIELVNTRRHIQKKNSRVNKRKANNSDAPKSKKAKI